MFYEWLHEPAPSFSINAQRNLGIFQISFQHYGAAIIKRMRKRSR